MLLGFYVKKAVVQMLENIIYIIVSFIATIIGSLTGIGGGIVLKTLVDIFSDDPIVVVNFYITIIVFTMCIVSMYKQLRKGFSFDTNVLIGISLGSLLGGYLGEYVLNLVIQEYESRQIQLVQSIILFLTLLFLVVYTRLGPQRKKIEKPKLYLTFVLGLFLGSISIFLGIGGGPLNVSLLVILFGYGMKDAAVYSLATVFFSQIAKIVTILYGGNLGQFDLSLIPFLIIIAIAGGYLGTALNQKLNSKKIELVYIFFMVVLCFITLATIFKYWI